MKKVAKKRILLLLVTVLALILILFLKTVPIRTFYYQTTPACSSNLYGGGDNKYFKFTLLSGGSGKFSDEKSKLEALNIPQDGCEGSGLAPVDTTTLELHVL